MSYTNIGYTDSQIQALIDVGYIPVFYHTDLNAVRTVYSGGSKRVFAQGTKWDTGEINTLGVADKYVQVGNIDLTIESRPGGVYDNAGLGWNPIGINFSGIYDGGGYKINGMWMDRTSNYAGLFRDIRNGAILKNIVLLNCEINFSAWYVGGIVGMAYGTLSKIENCLAHGAINHTGAKWAGGILGARNSAFTDIVGIEDCYSAMDIISDGELNGGIAGQISEATSYIKNCISVGKIRGTSNANGLCGYAEHDAKLIYSYYNKDTTPDSTDITGGRTTDELVDGSPSNNVFTDWNTSTWLFQTDKYPILNLGKSISVNYKPPSSVASVIDSNDDIDISWGASPQTPLGYDIYINNAKVNSSLITDLSYQYTPSSPGDYDIDIKAYYWDRYKINAGSSNVKDEAYYLPSLVKVSGNDVIIADGRDYDNTDFQTTIGLPVAKEYGVAESNIAQTNITTILGTSVGTWYGDGTEIIREYEDTKRKITQTITVDSRKITIANSIEYKQTLQIEYEGFEYSGFVGYSRKRNVYGFGTGQNIINNTGMYFHNGNYTMHKVLADIQEDMLYKDYINGDTESCTLYLLDGRDHIPLRVLTQPDGYNACFTISNHADGADLERQRAIFYGSSNISDSRYGTKGMIKNGVLADWSVFAKPDIGVTAFHDDPEYKAFLIELVVKGNEVIPHTTASTQDHRADAIIYLPEYMANFVSNNWIDHDLAGGNITLGINSKGWDITDATNYILDLFETNGFIDAWAYRDFDYDRIESSMWGFNNNIAYFNDHLKLPSGDGILLWVSSNRPIYNGILDIDSLIDDCGNVDAHEYLANTSREADEDTVSFTRTYYDDNGTYRITTGFENLLQKIALKKSLGELWNPSNTDWNTYFKKLKDVRVSITNESTLSIVNDGNAIDGFSILIFKDDITATLNGHSMNIKSVKDGTICWGDLSSGINTLILA